MKFKTQLELGKYLKSRRVALEMEQKDISFLLGYSSPQIVSNWERGVVTPPLKSIQLLEIILGLQQESILNSVLELKTRRVKNELLNKNRRGKVKRRNLSKKS